MKYYGFQDVRDDPMKEFVELKPLPMMPKLSGTMAAELSSKSQVVTRDELPPQQLAIEAQHKDGRAQRTRLL